MRLEDGLLLGNTDQAAEVFGWANKRLTTHLEREAKRKRTGLKTDLQRYLDGEETHD